MSQEKGGTECFAQDGDNSMHAVFDNKVCAATHPSTVVTALVALGARVQVAKQSFDWPLVDVAVVLAIDGRVCKQATIVLGAVAPVPRRAVEAERVLVGSAVDIIAAGKAAQAAIASATPLAHNDHKVQILKAVLARTILNAMNGRAS